MARSQRPSGDPSVGGLLGRQHPVYLVDAGRGGGPLLDTRRQCGDDPHGVRNADSRRLKTATTAHDEDEISRSSCSPTAPTLPIRTRRRNRRHRLGSKSLIEAARTLHAHRITARQRRATLGFGPSRAPHNPVAVEFRRPMVAAGISCGPTGVAGRHSAPVTGRARLIGVAHHTLRGRSTARIRSGDVGGEQPEGQSN